MGLQRVRHDFHFHDSIRPEGYKEGFPDGSDDKEFACNIGDPGSIPGLGRFPGEGKSNPLQYYFLENSMDRRVWRAAVHGVAKKWI